MRSLLLAVVLAGCSSRLPAPSQPDAVRAQATWPDTTVAELARGRQLVQARCASCHQPPAPRSHPPQAWPGLVEEMAERAHLSGDEQDLMIRYLVTMSQRR